MTDIQLLKMARMLRFYANMFGTLKDYYNDKWEALIVFVGILGFNLLSILVLFNSIIGTNVLTSPFFLDSGGYFEERFYTMVTYYLPLCLIVLIVYLLNKQKVKTYIEEYKSYSREIKRKKGKLCVVYVILSIIFFFVSVFVGDLF